MVVVVVVVVVSVVVVVVVVVNSVGETHFGQLKYLQCSAIKDQGQHAWGKTYSLNWVYLGRDVARSLIRYV